MEQEAIVAALAQLFDRAMRERLWFYSAYQSLWFSPEQLREQQAQGHFVWGAVNWTLRDPDELVERDRKIFVAARDAYERTCAEVSKWKKSQS